MLNRWIGITSLLAMLVANVYLFLRDIAPDLLAGDPPLASTFNLKPGDKINHQSVLLDGEDRIIGYSFTDADRSAELLSVRTWTVLDGIPLPANIPAPKLKMVTEFKYGPDNHLDNMNARVYGLGVPVEVRGEFVPPDSFPCEWRFADARGSFLLPAIATRQLADSFRPFDTLPGLWVGRAWRVDLMNPLAGALPGFADGSAITGGSDGSLSARTVIVRVTGLETIHHNGQEIESFVVKADKVTAWVALGGAILRQEMDMPLLGKIKIVTQDYDPALKRKLDLEPTNE